MKESKTLHRVLAAALTILFLGFIFTALGVTLARHHKDLMKSVQMDSDMRAALPKRATPLDKLQARINGFTAGIADVMWMKTELGYVNSAFQYGLGKRMINTGSQNMLTLNTGHLYDLNGYQDLSKKADEIIALRQSTFSDIPFLFVYEHPTLYDDAMMPLEYAELDASARMADEVTAALRAGGIETLDSRQVLKASGLPLSDLLMVTDQHWTTLAAITMGRSIAEKLNDMTGASLDASWLDPANLNTEVHEALFMGKYGQRVGVGIVRPDDITEYWPTRDTHIHRTTLRKKEIEEADGPFRDAVTRFESLKPDPGKTWNIMGYTVYGLTEPYSLFENPDAPDYTIMLLKDSFSAPIGTFLSLTARHVVCLDTRQDIGSLQDWIDRYHPDAVVMAYSLQMLRGDNYAFQ